jgi:hypothetical protein
MPVLSPKAFAFTNVPTASNDISPLIRACFPFFTHCTKANVSDDQGLIEMLSQNLDYFRAKPVNIPKITILLDNGYHPEVMTAALQDLYPQIMTKIRFELAPKPTKAEKAALGKRDL